MRSDIKSFKQKILLGCTFFGVVAFSLIGHVMPLALCAIVLKVNGGEKSLIPIWAEKHPVIACTPDELSRLRTAYHVKDKSRAPVLKIVKSAEKALMKPVIFPPRGGQHNQWYQCDTCQTALKTVDATHHQCPKCKHIYTGEPYDDVIFSRVHSDNLKRLHAAAWAYAVTGDLRFADFARQVLLGYADRYRQYPYHSASRNQSNWERDQAAICSNRH